MTLRVDGAGALNEVELSFAYDEFFSLLILEDMGVDQDADGVLTKADKKKLFGFDVDNWPDGFDGDFYVGLDGQHVDLPRSVATGIDLVDGKIIATQTRAIPAVPAAQAVIRQYDPTFYVHYTLKDVVVEGPCDASIAPYDPSASEQALMDALENITDDQIDVLELGIYYADKIQLTCTAGS